MGATSRMAMTPVVTLSGPLAAAGESLSSEPQAVVASTRAAGVRIAGKMERRTGNSVQEGGISHRNLGAQEHQRQWLRCPVDLRRPIEINPLQGPARPVRPEARPERLPVPVR